MAQLVARLVRNEKVGGSNPPSSTTGRHPIADVGFLYAWARWCGACRCVACGAAGVPGAGWPGQDPLPPTGTVASPVHSSSPASASARSHAGVESLFSAVAYARPSRAMFGLEARPRALLTTLVP